MKTALSLVLVFLGVCAGRAVQQQAQRGPSTQEERQRFVAIAHKLEDAPLDESLRKEREWGLLWLIQVPDVSVAICTAPLGDFMSKKYKYSPEIVTQLTFSSGVFVIEHPDEAKDPPAQILAGVEGALKAYQSILKTNPKARAKALDDLLELQREGKLAEHVRESAAKGCAKKV